MTKRRSLLQAVQLVANLGAVAGIVFLGLEVRQNTATIRSSIIQDISYSSYELTMIGVELPDLRSAWRSACAGTLTEDQRQQISTFYGAALRLQANRFYQVRLGLLTESEAIALGGRGVAYRRPIFKEIWPERRDEFAPEFQEYVERELLPLSTTSC